MTTLETKLPKADPERVTRNMLLPSATIKAAMQCRASKKDKRTYLHGINFNFKEGRIEATDGTILFCDSLHEHVANYNKHISNVPEHCTDVIAFYADVIAPHVIVNFNLPLSQMGQMCLFDFGEETLTTYDDKDNIIATVPLSLMYDISFPDVTRLSLFNATAPTAQAQAQDGAPFLLHNHVERVGKIFKGCAIGIVVNGQNGTVKFMATNHEVLNNAFALVATLSVNQHGAK